MKYILTESQFKMLIETDDRKSNDSDRRLRMINRFLDMTFDNMIRVDTKFGSGYKFDGDNQYQLNILKSDSGQLQLAISSSFIKNVVSMFGIDRFEASELIAEYCSDVLGMEFDFIRSWPIPIKEEISEVKKVEDFDEDYSNKNHHPYDSYALKPQIYHKKILQVHFFLKTHHLSVVFFLETDYTHY